MRIGRYEVLGEIGRGGAGVVYKARAEDGSIVALKMLRAQTAQSRARFEREARLLASVAAREGFVPLADVGEVAEGPYIVMPFLPGGTLRARLAREGMLPVDEAIELGVRVATALGIAHGRGVLHRDVKPENILFDDAGRPLLADLGLAKHFTDDVPGASRSVSLSQTGSFRGTAGYMAPEQMLGVSDLGPPADVFALGSVLFECLAGRGPFAAPTLLEVVTKTSEGAVPDLRSLRSEVPRAVARVVLRALASDPARRYADAAELAQALRDARAPRAARSSKPFLAAGAALLVAVGGAAVLLRRGGGGEQPPPAVRTESAAEHVERAKAALEKHDPSAALVAASRAIDLEPRLGEAWALRAEARAARLDRKHAEAEATRAIELDPRCARAWTVRAELRATSRRGARATIDDATKAIELEPGLARAWAARALARLVLAEGDVSGIADAERSVALDARCWQGLVARGIGRSAKHDRDAALADLDRAVALEPASPLAWTYRGMAKFTRNDIEGALADLAKAVALDPELSVAWDVFAIVRMVRGEYDAAMTALDRAIASDPESTIPIMRRASLLHVRGDLDGAIAEATRAIELDPDLADSYHVRGLAFLKKNDVAAARADLDAALARNPSYAEAYADRSGLRGRTGDMEGLLADAQKAIELEPRLGVAWANRGRALFFKGDPQAAVRDATRALELDPTIFLARATRAEAYAALNDLERAEADYTQIIETEADARAYEGRGTVRARRGDAAGARADYREALARDPARAEAIRALLAELDRGR